jgi:uncharacterized membrane protein YkoI
MTITRNSASRPSSNPLVNRAGALVFTVLMGVPAAVSAVDAHTTVARAARVAGGPLLLAQATPSVSADQAAAAVRAASGGRILDVRLESRSRPPVYHVKVLLDGGRVRVYRVDASNGRVLE